MVRVVLVLGLILLAGPAASHAGEAECGPLARQLSLPIPRASDVDGFAISPDGAWVVYRADAEVPGRLELYSAPLHGGPVVKLSPPFESGEVGLIVISPTSDRVLFTLDQPDGLGANLYSVPIGGGSATLLNPPLTHSGGVSTVRGRTQFTPDGNLVVFVSRHVHRLKWELYSVPSTGGEVTRLNEVGPGEAVNFDLSPDGSQVAYIGEPSWDNLRELFLVPSTGGEVTRLNQDLVEGGEVTGSLFTSDGNYVVYLTDRRVVGKYEIWSVRLSDLARFRLSKSPAINGSVWLPILLSPDSSRVVYLGDLDVLGQIELYSVGIEGGASTKLNAPMIPDGDVVNFDGAALSADGSTVVYMADEQYNFIEELLSVPVAGGPVTNLSFIGSFGSVMEFALDPTSTHAVFRVVRDPNYIFEVQSVPIGGGPITTLNPPLDPTADVKSFEICPDGDSVAYRADQDTDNVSELYSVSITGGASTRLNTPLEPGRQVQADPDNYSFSERNFRFDPGGDFVVYLADAGFRRTWELYRSLLPYADTDGDLQDNCSDPCPLDSADDADGDSVCADEDCAPADGDLWRIPGQLDLRLGRAGDPPDMTVLSWTAETGGVASPIYDTLRSSDATDFGPSSAVCVESDDDTDTMATDPDTPGDLFFYLVVPENACGRAPGEAVYSSVRQPRECS